MLSHHIQDRGTLSYVDFDDLNFKPQRMYFIYGVPKGEVRGKHGHKKDKQYLTCVKGQVKVRLTSKSGTKEVILNKGESVFVDTMVWGEQQYMTGDDIMHVLCSTKFDKDDYIYDLSEIIIGEING
tara:strand:+ start:530 stop:907 length:378 start_codon:yes stop_codon:yes gene_type:complete